MGKFDVKENEFNWAYTNILVLFCLVCSCSSFLFPLSPNDPDYESR